MTERHDLLVEIGTEELPPKTLRQLMAAFAGAWETALDQQGLVHGEVKRYATPRRLAVLVQDVAASQPDRMVDRRGPVLRAAFDEEGDPTPAAQGFARACGVNVEQLETLETPQGAWLIWRTVQQGTATRELLPDLLKQALASLPVARRMRWGYLREDFVRPVHWVVLLFGNHVVDVELYQVRAGRETRGHRYHHPQSLFLAHPRAYAPLLETEGHVLPDFDARKEAIRAQVEEAARTLGGRAVIDERLLEEVTALVEWPVALAGDFEARFLALPPEPLVSTMQDNQKYFHVVDEQGGLLPHFITVCNIDSRDPAQVKAGNERVIRPRFSDAAFFWDQDRRLTLRQRREHLKTVLYHAKLGSLYDKSERMAHLVKAMMPPLHGDTAQGESAAQLAKCDLLSLMVGEFPALQGVMGRHYAYAEGLPADVAEALGEQYLPRHAGDRLPRTPGGQALAIADKLDTLVGIFAAGEPPTGDKDPYALRRAALGMLRIVIECALPLDLEALLQVAAEAYRGGVPADKVTAEVYDFIMERLRTYYTDKGVRPDEFEAVLACRPARPYDFDLRLRGVQAFRALPEAEGLAAANKRIRNVLRQAVERGEKWPLEVEETRLAEPAERALYHGLCALRGEVNAFFDRGDYTAGLCRLAGLRRVVDAFFDHVMVMTEDQALRRNRLALLAELHALFLRAADFSRLQ